jgi:hypothetical protein
MGRLVKPPGIVSTRVVRAEVGEGEVRAEEADGRAEEKVVKEQAGDTYLERVAKYVPAEIIAFFLFANNLLKQTLADAPQGQVAKMANFDVIKIGVVMFLIAWILTPIYLWRLREEGDAWKLNALLAFLLFPVWAYAIEAVGLHPIIAFDGHLASILLGAATLVSGLVSPRPKSASSAPPAAEKTQATIASRVRELIQKRRGTASAGRQQDGNAAAGMVAGRQLPHDAPAAPSATPQAEVRKAETEQ